MLALWDSQQNVGLDGVQWIPPQNVMATRAPAMLKEEIELYELDY